VELHEGAVDKLTESRHFARAEAARMRLMHARKRLEEALEQERLFLRRGYAAMAAGSDPGQVAHAVADAAPVSLCGLKTAFLVGVAEDFGELAHERQCPECLRAIEGRT